MEHIGYCTTLKRRDAPKMFIQESQDTLLFHKQKMAAFKVHGGYVSGYSLNDERLPHLLLFAGVVRYVIFPFISEIKRLNGGQLVPVESSCMFVQKVPKFVDNLFKNIPRWMGLISH